MNKRDFSNVDPNDMTDDDGLELLFTLLADTTLGVFVHPEAYDGIKLALAFARDADPDPEFSLQELLEVVTVNPLAPKGYVTRIECNPDGDFGIAYAPLHLRVDGIQFVSSQTGEA
jgi:hypothetical protein